MNRTFLKIASTENERKAVIELLLQQNLPVTDIDVNKQLYVLKEGANIIGTAGLEIFDSVALLRSISISKDEQGKGYGKNIVDQMEKRALENGINCLYLLTTTAKDFFQKQGYSAVHRTDVPASVQQTTEFTSLCPASAIVMKKELSMKKKLLFVCIENSNRSQMSQAFAKIHGGENVEAYSAGSKPSGIVNPKAIAAMKELGYDLSTHDSKSLDEVKAFAPFDAVVTMGCGDACPWMPAKQFIDWQIPDPKNMEPKEFNEVRNFIEGKVKELIHSLQ